MKSDLIQSFIRMATENPDRIAVVDRGGVRRTTYGELYLLARRVAGYLQSLSLPANSFFPIVLPSSMEYVAVELGVWMSGNAFVPMGEHFPEARIHYIKEHCQAPLIVDAEVLLSMSACDPIAEPIIPECEATAALFYTSGSTGNPKGVVHTFASLDFNMQRQHKLFGTHPDDSFGTGAPFYFIAVTGVYGSLYSGATVHIYSEETRTDLHLMEEYIRQEGVTMIFLSPSVLGRFKNRSKKLRRVLVGGERLSGIAPDGYELWNVYGMTETCSMALTFQVDKAYDNTPIGRPTDEVEVCVMDDEGRQLPQGEEGELCVKGIFTSGYYKEEEKTRDLLKDGWLHTGDIAKQLPDGNYIYINRKDWMVKINGQRVEPGEVEATVKKVPGIEDAVVKGFRTDTGSQYLCAYYISQSNVTEEQIRETISKTLPPYMVPTYFIQMEKFPLNNNGKIDRKSFTPPDRSSMHAGYVAPRNETEEKLCAAFASALGIDKVGIDDDFFRLGGDSIRVMTLQQRCPTLPLSAKMIYRERTPRRIAEQCSTEVESQLERCEDYPLSQTQMGIYVACMGRQGEAAYNNPRLYRLGSSVDMERMAAALEAVVEAHSFIKTRLFTGTDGEPRQRRNENEKYRQTIERLTDTEFDALRSDLVRPFDLLADQLFRIRLFETETAKYMFFDFHHIIFDGMSGGVFMDDLNSAYNGTVPESETWSEFEVAQEEEAVRRTEEYTEAEEWYRQQFGDLDTDSQPLPDCNGKEISFGRSEMDLSFDYDRIDDFCRETGITANVLTTAAFGYLLGVYTNASDALFATIYNGRTHLRTARTMGMLVKTLPVYCHWQDDTQVRDFLLELKDQMLGSMSHDIYSFAELCAANPSITSKILFAYQGSLPRADILCGAPFENVPLNVNATGEILTVQLFRNGQKMTLTAEYHENRYSPEFIVRLMRCYETVLQGLMTEPLMRQVEILPSELLTELDAFNNTETAYDTTQSIVSLFRQQAAAKPDNIAVIYQDKQYTYKEVDEISERIGQYIQSKGIGRGEVIPILIPRCEYMVIASLGVLKAGCAYQPLDPTYPAERLNFMVQDTSAKLLIADETLRPILSEYEGDVLLLNDIPELPNTGEKLPEVKSEDLFILLYTSGSTGQPKGCMLYHGNIVALCDWYRRYYGLRSEDRVGAYASYGFDACTQDIYPALTTGAACCVIGEDIRLDMVALNDYLEKNHISHLFITTQVGRQFALDVENHSLRHLAVGGEKLVPLDPPAGYHFHNIYGPTECTVLATIYEVKKYEDNIPIGKAINNVKLYIVDQHGHRVPVGALGELWIAGHQVSRGYLNRPEQTEKTYIPNPFNTLPGYERVYRTGDVVRYLSDGNLEFIGRRDSQVKIRGFRIELTEVEAVIRDFPGIDNATVAAFDDPNGGKFIAAYVVSGKPVDISALNEFIRSRKPPYMVPAVTMQIDSIPLNQNMKVNKRALPEPKLQAVEESEETNRPLNLLEQELVGIVGDIIHANNFGVTTELSYLGLTSISAIKLSTAIYKRFGLNIPSKTLVSGASVQSIGNELIRHWMEKPEKETVTVASQTEKRPMQDAYPLSYAQQGVYYDCMKRPTEVIYNIPAMISFDSSIDADTLVNAVKEIVLAHPFVMTHFEMRGEEVMQVREEHPVSVSREEMGEEELEAYKKAFVRPFNLSKGPLYRLAVVRTDRRVCLLFDFHHLVFDGMSLDLFFHVLKRKLEGLPIEKETYSYYDYVADEKQAEQTPHYQQNRDFFDNMLSGSEGSSEITPDLGGLAENGMLEECIHPLDSDRITAYCRENHVTAAGLCLAAAFYTVSRYVNSKQVYLSTISSGRSDVRTSDSFGMFVKTLPLGISIGDQTAGEFIARSGELLSDVIAHEDYPFAKIAADYGFVPEIVYACQLGILEDWTLKGHPVKMESMELKISKFKLSIHIEERNGSPAIVLQYNNALYSHNLMESFARSMANVLQGMTDAPSTPLKHISLLDADREKQLAQFRVVGEAPIAIGLYHKALELQAERQPDHTALIASDGTYTYAELNACANRIANGLIKQGVTPRSRVALLLPRTGRVIMSMFGVMKTGSAYIPCDPEYPVERINHILEDSGAAYIITTSDRVADFGSDKALDVETLLACPDTTAPQTDVTPDDLAYLIYTSGSTGKPKGVMLRHEGICNYLTDHPVNRHVHALVTDAHIFLSVTTVSFDMSLKEIGTTLFNGLTLVFADENQANNPILLSELFERTHADAFNATPSRMLQYMELPAFCCALSKCNVIMCGGEKYPDGLLDRLREITHARIFNTYGPTEITVSSNGKELTQATEISVGRPLLNYREYIVDSDGNELPAGVVGELYIGGVGVAAGYNNLDEMTREHFIEYCGGRVYKSGDYARWTPDGDVMVLGRTDNQVKLRGLRIELGEVESAIVKTDGIKAAVVMIRKLRSSEHLCAYFTADRKIEIGELKEELKKTLAPYMVPTAYLQLESMPLTPNGKTDLKALPEPQLFLGGHGEAAANAVERRFCEIFAEILGLDNVGATDSFFDLGGTSLAVARIIIEANKSGFEVAYGDVFSNPSPRALAAKFITAEKEATADKEVEAYDYSSLQPILDANTLDNLRNGERQPVGDILLTGATGFLGIHLLKEFLDKQSGKVYCLLRSKGNVSGELRLKTVLFYYFDNSFDELFGKRIFAIEGDVTNPTSLEPLYDNGISTVFNCAANVKHFSKGTDIEDVNIGGAANLTAFCLHTGARLVHVSTMSVGGMSVDGYPAPGTRLSEHQLYFGQFIANKYIHSKFLAERLILENIRDHGLNAKIMRVGNLSARNSDGEFQINYSTNTFMGRLKSYRLLGKCTYEQLDAPMEFSPIDEVAKAILLLATTPKECCVFHPYNHHYILSGDIFAEMEHAGFRVEAVEAPEFAAAMAEAEADPRKARILSSMIAYQNMAHGKPTVPIAKDNAYTMQVLYRLGYRWPATSWDYVTRFLRSLQGLGFFDE